MIGIVALDALGLVDRAAHARRRRPSYVARPGPNIARITSRWSPRASRRSPSAREAVAVGAPLVFLPAGADPELEAAAADDVDRRRQLRGERRVPEPGADDHVTEPHPARRHRQGRQRRERLEGDLVGRLRDGVEVIERPRATRSRAPRPAAASSTVRAHAVGRRPSRRTRPSSPAAPSDRPASEPPRCLGTPSRRAQRSRRRFATGIAGVAARGRADSPTRPILAA